MRFSILRKQINPYIHVNHLLTDESHEISSRIFRDNQENYCQRFHLLQSGMALYLFVNLHFLISKLCWISQPKYTLCVLKRTASKRWIVLAPFQRDSSFEHPSIIIGLNFFVRIKSHFTLKKFTYLDPLIFSFFRYQKTCYSIL